MSLDDHAEPPSAPHPRSTGSVLLLLPLLRAFVAAFVVSLEAHAQMSPDFDLTWTAPSSCPDEAAVKAHVARLAPNPAARNQPLRVDGAVRQGPHGFVLELMLRDGEFESRRRFDSDSCDEVVGAAAVTIALLLSSGTKEATSDAGVESAADQREPEAGAASAAGSVQGGDVAARRNQSAAPARAPRDMASAVPPQSPGSQELPAERRWHLILAAPALSVGFGLLPDASVGVGGGLGVEAGGWRVLAGGVWNFDVGVGSPGASDHGADISRRIARLSACRWLGSSRLQLAPCATVALELLVAHGVGSGIAAEEADSAWLALGPGMVADLRLTDWVRLAASLGLEFQTARPVLVIEGLGEVEQIGVLELSTLVGAEWIF